MMCSSRAKRSDETIQCGAVRAARGRTSLLPTHLEIRPFAGRGWGCRKLSINVNHFCRNGSADGHGVQLGSTQERDVSSVAEIAKPPNNPITNASVTVVHHGLHLTADRKRFAKNGTGDESADMSSIRDASVVATEQP